MTDAEFDVLAAQMRLKVPASASSRALRGVLVQGLEVEAAAAREKLHPTHVQSMLDSVVLCLQRARVLALATIPQLKGCHTP